MALYFPNSDSLLLLTPKAGSTWLRAALDQARVYTVALGPHELRGHGYLALYGRGFHKIVHSFDIQFHGTPPTGPTGIHRAQHGIVVGVLTTCAKARTSLSILALLPHTFRILLGDCFRGLLAHRATQSPLLGGKRALEATCADSLTSAVRNSRGRSSTILSRRILA